jgi:alkanesulfonate monooxygenase SsuD/methylene tetrahydromethanopterin reductase-like flavin-dependent oxidoreductase (luciferase family)
VATFLGRRPAGPSRPDAARRGGGAGRGAAGPGAGQPRLLLSGGADAVQLDPMPLLGSLVPHSRVIGLGALVFMSHTEPFHTARAFAVLDTLSAGRAAWCVDTRQLDCAPADFAQLPLPATADVFLARCHALEAAQAFSARLRAATAAAGRDPAALRILLNAMPVLAATASVAQDRTARLDAAVTPALAEALLAENGEGGPRSGLRHLPAGHLVERAGGWAARRAGPEARLRWLRHGLPASYPRPHEASLHRHRRLPRRRQDHAVEPAAAPGAAALRRAGQRFRQPEHRCVADRGA